VSYETIDALRESLAQPTQSVRTPEYIAKMMHQVPAAESIDRPTFILERCRGKRVLEFGSSGPLSTALRGIAAAYVGVDREATDGVLGFDLDDVVNHAHQLPFMDKPDVIVCGELIEHLTNPGYFLDRLQSLYLDVPVIISVPNAFSPVAQHHLNDGIENVNADHVAWYSPKTIKTLLARYGYEIAEFYWYNGAPLTAEGLIVVTKGSSRDAEVL